MSAETEGGMRQRKLGKRQQAKIFARLMLMQSEVAAKVEGCMLKTEQAGDRCDVAQQETLVQLDLAHRQNGQELLQEIKEARARIESGTYGVCMECEEDIPLKRLETRPTARLCLECQKEHEVAQARQQGRRPAYAGI